MEDNWDIVALAGILWLLVDVVRGIFPNQWFDDKKALALALLVAVGMSLVYGDVWPDSRENLQQFIQQVLALFAGAVATDQVVEKTTDDKLSPKEGTENLVAALPPFRVRRGS